MTTTRLQQQIVTPDNSPVSSSTETELVAPQLLYLDVKVVEVSSDTSSNWNIPTDQEPFQTLKLGGTYSLEVSYSTFPGHYSKQKGIPYSSKPQFYLSCSTIDFDNSEFVMDTSRKKFDFVVSQDAPTCDVEFTIYYREEKGQTAQVATILRIKQIGNYNLDNPKLIEATQIDTSLATQTAILHITADMNKMKITGWSRRGKILQTDPMDWGERKTLAEDIKLQKSPKSIRSEMRRFSRTKAIKLTKWVRDLLAEHGEHFCLIIADHTHLETPWEMLELNDDEYLGAKVVVVRWMKINTFNGPRVLKPQSTPKQEDPGRRRVLFYLDETLGTKQVYHEKEMLNSLCVERCGSLEEVENRLELLNTMRDIGLIYLGCHGYEGETLGSRQNSLTYLDLEMIPEVKEPRPIVFVNACESARLKREGDYFSGLPEPFLARIACGYVGTLGQVGSMYASDVAKRLLQEARNNTEGVRVAEVLRKLREKVVNDFLSCRGMEERISKQKELIYAFMYVYYGDYQARLRLDATEIPEVRE